MVRKAEDKTKELRRLNDQWVGYWKSNNERYHRYMDFVYSEEMWETSERDALIKYNKVPLTFNKLITIVNSISGEQAQNDVQQIAVPLSDNITPKQVEIREAILKKVSADSDSKMVYTKAFRQALVGGFGAMRADHEYESDKSFNQTILLHSVEDPTKCFWDPNAKTRGKTDGLFCGQHYYMSKKAFGKKYGKKLANQLPNCMESEGDGSPKFTYVDEDSVCILEVYEREFKKEKIFELEDGRVVNQEELDELEAEQQDERYPILQEEREMPQSQMLQETQQPMMPQPEFGAQQDPQAMGIQAMEQQPQDMEQPPMDSQFANRESRIAVRSSRTVDKDIIKRYKIAGDHILEETTFPSTSLPLVFVDQESYMTKTGAQVTRPFVQAAKDAQTFLNYLGTQIAYLVKISRYDQFMASRKNVEGTDIQQMWRNPQNIQGTLIYNVDMEGGTKPERLAPPELSASLMQQYSRALDDVQTSTGVFATQLGAQGQEISGSAIDARTQRGNNNTYIVFDSLNNAITELGRVINQMIPNIYDTPRTLMLEQDDVGIQPTEINKPIDAYGGEVENDVTKGEFGIKIKAGPSFEAQKAEALESLKMVLQAGGERVFGMVADLVAENLPVPNNIEIKNRLKTLVPPEIIEAGKTGKPIPQKPQQPDPQMMMMQADMQFKQQDLQLKQQKLQQEAQENQQKLKMEEAQLQLKYAETQASLEREELKVAAELDRTHADQEIQRAKLLSDVIGKQAHEVKKQ